MNDDTTNQPQKQPLSLPELFELYPDVTDAALLSKVATGELSIGRVRSRWGEEIMQAYFPPVKWIIPDYLPEGLTILAGRPKTGKSWLCLQFLRTISTGGEFFGKKVQQRHCLYLTVEDYPERLYARIIKQGWPKKFSCTFETKIPKKLDKGGLAWLVGEIDINKFELIVIDTISQCLSPKARQNASEDMTAVYSVLQSLAFEKGISILLVDHLRKESIGNAEDAVDSISGSTAKAAVADTILGLWRKKNQPEGQLKITGRDVIENDLAVEFDANTCSWKLLGNSSEVIEDRSARKLYNIILESGGLTSKAIEDETGWSKGYVSKMLAKLDQDGLLIRGGRGEAHKVVDIDLELSQTLVSQNGKQ